MLRIPERSGYSLHQTPLREGSHVIPSPVQPSSVGCYPQLLFQRSWQGFFFFPPKKKTLPHLKICKNSKLSYTFPNDLAFIWSLTVQTTLWPSGCWNWDLPEKARDDVVWTIAPDFLLLEGATESCLLLFREWEFRLRFIKASHFFPPEVFPFRMCSSCYYVFNFSANICACI